MSHVRRVQFATAQGAFAAHVWRSNLRASTGKRCFNIKNRARGGRAVTGPSSRCRAPAMASGGGRPLAGLVLVGSRCLFSRACAAGSVMRALILSSCAPASVEWDAESSAR